MSRSRDFTNREFPKCAVSAFEPYSRNDSVIVVSVVGLAKHSSKKNRIDVTQQWVALSNQRIQQLVLHP